MRRFVSALLAHPDSAGLKYAGTAFIALGDEARAEFLAEVERLTNESDAMGCSPLTLPFADFTSSVSS
jgi:hypothetical protein